MLQDSTVLEVELGSVISSIVGQGSESTRYRDNPGAVVVSKSVG